MVRKEGAQDGDSRSALAGAGRGRRGVPGADRAAPAGAAGALLPGCSDHFHADAEDAVQETLLAAWQGIGEFTEPRASLRTWLCKIATQPGASTARRAACRRPAREWDMSRSGPPVPTPRDEPVWLQPFPDAHLEGAADRPLGPEARYNEQAEEAISLAFVTALQLLPPRQLAVLVLRDVLGFHASEVGQACWR